MTYKEAKNYGERCMDCEFCFELKDWNQDIRDFKGLSVCCYFPINARAEEKDKQPKYEHFALIIHDIDNGMCECYKEREK